MKDLLKLIPALRALFSTDRLIGLQLITQEGASRKLSVKDLIEAGYAETEKDILIVKGEDLEPDQLHALRDQWFAKNQKAPAVISIAELGCCAVSGPEPSNRLSGKVTVITGGAQGIGAGIAEMLFLEGAHIVIADLNADKGEDLVGKLNQQRAHGNRALFIATDVADPASAESMIDETVYAFGGVDILISNAGILHAGSLEEMTPEMFNRVTQVNYNGYFHCVKFASLVMKQQAAFNEDLFSDIIQINSKSGLKGSNKNFAYAGGKFGGIGLTQSFAMELIPYRIKVNAICPGNYFEGPLWSDPEKGLFGQYLRAGKVPGAKSLEDVRRHYEKQVPAGRGCRVSDVVKAILYVVDQEYETGQAVPVTGGQNMLH